MNRRHLIPTLAIILLLGLLLIAAIFGFLALTSSGGAGLVPSFMSSGAPPQVFILQPANGAQLASGQGLLLAAYVFAPAGAARVDFLVDGQVEQQFTPDGPSPELHAVFHWFAGRLGTHRLSVIAYDRLDQASPESFIEVGVLAEGALPPASAGAVDSGNQAPPVEDPVPSGAAGEEAVENVAPPAEEQGQAPVPEPPADAPPSIDRFEVVADVQFDAVSASILGSAVDDTGLRSLRAVWRNDRGDEGDSIVDCAGQPSCSLEAQVALGAGPWLFALQAVDVSGQAALPAFESVEVVGAPGLPPAVADHAGIWDWLDDRIGAIPGGLPVNPGFDLDSFLDGFGRPELPAGGEAVQADGQCLTIQVEPSAEGNQVTLTIRCELRVDEQDWIVFPHVGKSLVNTGDGGIALFISEWYDNRRTSLSPGDSFTWLDWDVTCGTPYRYAGRVDEGHVLDYTRDTFASVGLGANRAFASAEVLTPPCTPGSLADVNLRATAAADGVQVRWDVAGGGNWPADLGDQGARFILTRFAVDSEESFELYQDVVPTDLLLAGGEFTVLDDNVQCGNRYWYSLAAVPASADLNLVSPGWLLRAQAPGPDVPCTAQDIGSIQLHLRPYWFNASNVRVGMQMQLPPGFAWPQGDGVELQIVRMRQDENRCAAPPCVGAWQVKKSIQITDQIRANGLNYAEDDTSVSFGNYTYVYRLALAVERQAVQSGPNVSAVMPAAPPPPPEILRLTLSNNCPGGARRCVTIDWQRYEQPQPGGYYEQAESIAVERVVGAIDTQLFPVGMNETRYVDTNPLMQEFELVDGTIRRVCSYDVTYRMVAFGPDGHVYGASPLSVQAPGCDERWNQVVEPRQR